MILELQEKKDQAAHFLRTTNQPSVMLDLKMDKQPFHLHVKEFLDINLILFSFIGNDMYFSHA